jgi:hypothetical protein
LSPGLTPSPCTPPQRGRRCRPAGPRRHRRRPRGAAVPRRPERRRAILRRALRKRADPSAVSRIWRAFALKPHQVESFKLSPDPQFIDKVRDVVGLYLNPPEAAVVWCVDEKAPQALDRSAPVLPLMPGVPARQTHDYVRNGTTNHHTSHRYVV